MYYNYSILPIIYLFECEDHSLCENGATGDGSSWSNASGSIQNMIDKAMIGDEVWVSEGTYYPEKEYVLGGIKDRTFKLRPGVSLYGGFAGTERSLQERKKIDRDKME